MEPPPYEPLAGSSSSTGLAPDYDHFSGSPYPTDSKSKTAEVVDGEIRRWASLSSSSLSMDHPMHYTFQKVRHPVSSLVCPGNGAGGLVTSRLAKEADELARRSR